MKDDPQLDDLIRRSRVAAEIPEPFQREVWARIAVAEQASWTGKARAWGEAVLARFSRPAPAFAAIALMLGAGFGLGQAERGNAGPEEAAAPSRESYLASINPLAMPPHSLPE